MKHKVLFLAMLSASLCSNATSDSSMQKQLIALQKQTQMLQAQIKAMQSQMKQNNAQPVIKASPVPVVANGTSPTSSRKTFPTVTTHVAPLEIREPNKLDEHPESFGFYPTALIAHEHVVTYIAGTPVITAPYLGDRPAFDGSDYIVNISSINRDIRLMQQRRRIYGAYRDLGYPEPEMPILTLSGKVEALGYVSKPFIGDTTGKFDLSSSELDIAANLNRTVEGFMSFAFGSQTFSSNQRLANSDLFLNLGFINVGDLDRTPLYFTVGQLFSPFGRYSSAMISAPLPMLLARTKERQLILGYKSQQNTGPYAAVYGFSSDTTLGKSGVGGVNLGYAVDKNDWSGDFGIGYISSISDSLGMQLTGSPVGTTFGGFGSITNGNEAVQKIPAIDLHANANIGRFNYTAEWVKTTEAFRAEDLSFNGFGARPSAGQLEIGYTFKLWNKPASLNAGYQWTKNSLALNLPKRSLLGLFSISIWENTVESLEYRHDNDYSLDDYANGLAPFGVINANTYGTGRSADTVTAQIGVYF